MTLSKKSAVTVFLALAVAINVTAALMVREFASAKPAVAVGAFADNGAGGAGDLVSAAGAAGAATVADTAGDWVAGAAARVVCAAAAGSGAGRDCFGV